MAEVAQCGNTRLYLSPSESTAGNEACQAGGGGVLGNWRGPVCLEKTCKRIQDT